MILFILLAIYNLIIFYFNSKDFLITIIFIDILY